MLVKIIKKRVEIYFILLSLKYEVRGIFKWCHANLEISGLSSPPSVTLLCPKPYVLVSKKDQTPSPSLCYVIYAWSFVFEVGTLDSVGF